MRWLQLRGRAVIGAMIGAALAGWVVGVVTVAIVEARDQRRRRQLAAGRDLGRLGTGGL